MRKPLAILAAVGALSLSGCGYNTFEAGVVSGAQAVTQHLVKHFPADHHNGSELPDKPVVL